MLTVCSGKSIAPQRSPWLASVYVRPVFRHHGVASQLVTHIEAAAAFSGLERLYLFTPDQQHLYEQLGWSAIESLEYRDEPITVMGRDL